MTPTRPLGRRHAPDPRDAGFPLAAVIPATSDRTYRYWYERFNADQAGDTCVANSSAHFLGDSPKTHTLTSLNTRPGIDPVYQSRQSGERGFRGQLYDAAQQADEFSDTPPEGGTSVRAAMKVLSDWGLIDAYHWAAGIDDLTVAVLEVGPVIMGSYWYTGMDVPFGQFVKPTGTIRGGHAYVVSGINATSRSARIQTWGGHFKVTLADLATLLATDGEACIATERVI